MAKPPSASESKLARIRDSRRAQRDIPALIKAIREKDTVALARAITLVESTLSSDYEAAQKIIEATISQARRSVRIGITGVPGVGKSTFIEALGLQLLQQGKRVAVLAVDPSSSLTKGSILGDKTRMQELSRAPNAFIRPSPAGDSLGGVARKTRESIILCEAAGFDVILVETVGVGQSEVAVHGMVDFFLLLKLAGAGDELQGIKRGIVEMADAIVINKADGANLPQAKLARTTFENALHLYPPKPGGWVPKVLLCSSVEGSGIADVWELITDYVKKAKETGLFGDKRREQNRNWLKQRIEQQLSADFYSHPKIAGLLAEIEAQVREQQITPFQGASKLLEIYRSEGNTR
ncbi:methylmalonyl Co-A mutase-associated GTPase MeaB [Robiginitalea sp. IMCC44478]|uniref:methylmalonyl Co-A mutase-associated GTPase MeaB n=1 Tax=Robiginitalea sp. IMCC44478 TaxID=3459122 RepID=UPI00404130F8